jgi:alkyl hydroperoxide reductase subunit D
MSLDALRERFTEPAKDFRMNLPNVLAQGVLAPEQRLGVAIAVALAVKNRELARALIGSAELPPGVLEDAEAAAALMAMTNVLYRFKHLVGKAEYQELPARLRMMRLGQPASSKANLELFSLAVSAIAGCESCVRAHEKVLIDHGLTPEQIFEAVRVASVVSASATALAIADVRAA